MLSGINSGFFRRSSLSFTDAMEVQCPAKTHLNSINLMSSRKNMNTLEFGMYPQSMPTEWTHAHTSTLPECAPRFMTPRSQGFVGQSSPNLAHV